MGSTSESASGDERRAHRFEFTAGEEFAPDYVVVHRTGALFPDTVAEPVAGGGSSVVYRTIYKSLITRAVKLLAPRADLVAEQGLEPFARTFEREISTLAGVTHTRLAKIIDFGRVTINGDDHPYYAMDFIDGRHLDKVFHTESLSGREFLVLMDQILDGLEYLHLLGVMHSDLKEENVLVQRLGGSWLATIVDLGVAKTVKAPGNGQEPEAPLDEDAGGQIHLGPLAADRDLTHFFSTPKLMRPEWEERLRRPVTRSELAQMFPSHDLYAFGRLVGLALDRGKPLVARLESDLGHAGLQALETIRERLHRPPDSEYYRDVRALRQDWRKLDPGYLAPLGIQELAVGASAKTSIATPAGRVSLTERIAATINHPLVQRLRNIPQLEMLSLVYPGATHTRLLHALSTFDTARRYVSHLLNDPAFRLMTEPVEIEAALVWSLLHDVGHYPLSHMFEDLATEERRAGKTPTIPTDEDLFWTFVDPASVEGDFGAYPELVKATLSRAGMSPATLLNEHLLEPGRFSEETIAALHAFHQPSKPSHSILAGVVSSPIDVDKVAYLYDDSAMTGVRYGLGMDLDALLASLRAPREEDVTLGKPLLAISDKGLPAAEAVVLARYWMLKRVYWHHTSRATIAMVKFVISELLAAERLNLHDYFQQTLFSGATEGLRLLSDSYQRAAADGALDDSRPPRNPIPGLFGGNRRIYKRVLTVGSGPDADEKRLHDVLMRKPRDQLERLLVDAHAVVESVYGSPLCRGDVLIDIPAKEREELGAPVLVYSQRGGEQGRMLNEVSPLVSALEAEFFQHVKKFRVFLHPDVSAAVREKEGVVRQKLKEMLLRQTGLA